MSNMLADQGPTADSSLEQLGSEARAEFERLRAFLDLVDEPLPMQIGRYEIERVLGRGGMGVVHLARDPELNRSVALKLVNAGPFVNRERLHARLQREARVLARLRHPNVVGVYDVGTHEGELFVAMEYVAGTNLRVWQDAEPRTHEQVLAAYLQAARGLAAVHRAGIVHRDFKPDNVLIADDGRVLVGDFGLADDRDLDVAPDTDAGPDLGRTQTGALMGTLRYMAPERLVGEPASTASDQFEFCVSLWEGLTGQRPFVGEQRDVLLADMTHAPSGAAKLDRRTRRVLERGLASEPGRRFPDFDALIEALEHRSHPGRWVVGVTLAVIAGLAIARSVLDDPETCEVGERIDVLGEHQLVLPEGSPDSAAVVVQARFDRMIVELQGEAGKVCQIGEADELDRLDRWVDVLELVAEHSAELPITRTLDTLSELEFERDREPPELVNPEVARLLDEARLHIAVGRMAEAEVATEQANAIAEGRSDRSEVALRRGKLANWRGRPQTALDHYEDAIDDAEVARLDQNRLAAHLLAAPLALTQLEQRERADRHHHQAGLLLERLGVAEDDTRWIDHEQHEALIASEDGDFERALVIQQRVLDRRVANGDPLAIADARMRLAVIHQLRADHMADRGPDEAAAQAGYRQVLAELDALGVAPGHPTRLSALSNLGLLLFDLAGSSEQPEVALLMNAVVEAGPSSYYISALHVLLGLLVGFDAPTPAQLVEAERLTGLLLLELQAEDLAPRDQLDTWTIVASVYARNGDLTPFEAAHAKAHELSQAAVDSGMMTAAERDIHLAAHTTQVAMCFRYSNAEEARRLVIRASELVAKLPPEIAEKPDVVLIVASVAAASDALFDDSTR